MRMLPSVSAFIDGNEMPEEVLEQAEIQVKYAGYIEKEKQNADKLQRLENIRIPRDFDYMPLSSLSMEARQKPPKYVRRQSPRPRASAGFRQATLVFY